MSAGIKTRDEARAELGLGEGKGARAVKYNGNHDARGQFSMAENAVAPGSAAASTQVAIGPPAFEPLPFEPVKPPEISPAQPKAPRPSPPTELRAPATDPKPVPADRHNPPYSDVFGRAAELVDPALLSELVVSGVKITAENVVATGRMPDGKIVWLAKGDGESGLQHIVTDHAKEFADMNVNEAEIPRVVMDTVTKGTIIGYQGAGNGRPIFVTTIGGQAYRIAISLGSNGYIVGANPKGSVR